MSGRKKVYFQSMNVALNIISEINNKREFERYIFYTSFGSIVGKPKEMFKLEFGSEEQMVEVMSERLKNKEPVDAISIGNSFYLQKAKELYQNEENSADDGIAIPLEDVIITDHNGKVTNSNIFILYFDQVVGFMPYPE